MYIYILKCENDKYYVGKTINLQQRIQDHFDFFACAWTKLHKILHVDYVYQNCDPFDEDKYTIKYMSIFGIDNVRGGSYSSISLTREDKNAIEKQIAGAMDMCFYCKKVGHFSKDCEDAARLKLGLDEISYKMFFDWLKQEKPDANWKVDKDIIYLYSGCKPIIRNGKNLTVEEYHVTRNMIKKLKSVQQNRILYDFKNLGTTRLLYSLRMISDTAKQL